LVKRPRSSSRRRDPVETKRSDTLAFSTLCFVPVFTTLLFGGVDNTTWIFLFLFSVVLFGLWLFRPVKELDQDRRLNSLFYPILGLLLLGVLQLFPLGGVPTSSLQLHAVSALSMDPYSTRLFVGRFAVLTVFLLACITYIDSEKRVRYLIWGITVFGALLAFFGILQRLANPDGIYGMRETPQAIPFGPFVNQHHFAGFMQMTGGAALALLLTGGHARDKKILLALGFITMAAAAIFTSSRGGLLGFLAMSASATVLSYFANKKRSTRKTDPEQQVSAGGLAMVTGSIGFVIVIVGLVLFLGGNDALVRGMGATGQADISSGRLHFWPVALQIFQDHPIIGAGFDAFGVAYTRYDTWSGSLRVEQAHNEYLQMLAEGGVIAIVCTATFIFLLFRKGFQNVTRASGLLQTASIGALAGCLGILVHSFFDFPLRTPSNAFFFLLLSAIAVSNIKPDRASER
jgi:O-antigen ligase